MEEKKEEKQETKKTTNMVGVRLIRRKGQAALVEYGDDAKRVVVPANEVTVQGEEQETVVSSKALESGVEYGVPWEEFIPGPFTVTAADLARELRKAGVYTVEDFEKNPNAVVGAVANTQAAAFAGVSNAVKTFKSKEK